jgi:hypothetical protein
MSSAFAIRNSNGSPPSCGLSRRRPSAARKHKIPLGLNQRRPSCPDIQCVCEVARRQREGCRRGYQTVVDLDLAKFFDRVHHQRLLARLTERVKDQRILALIRLMLKAAVIMPDGTCGRAPVPATMCRDSVAQGKPETNRQSARALSPDLIRGLDTR